MLHDARHVAPHHHFGSKWSRTGGMRRAPTDPICLDFLGGVTLGYSVAIRCRVRVSPSVLRHGLEARGGCSPYRVLPEASLLMEFNFKILQL